MRLFGVPSAGGGGDDPCQKTSGAESRFPCPSPNAAITWVWGDEWVALLCELVRQSMAKGHAGCGISNSWWPGGVPSLCWWPFLAAGVVFAAAHTHHRGAALWHRAAEHPDRGTGGRRWLLHRKSCAQDCACVVPPHPHSLDPSLQPWRYTEHRSSFEWVSSTSLPPPLLFLP